MPAVFAHGALRLYLLSLLAEGPKHGYDVIQALSERFGGAYSPSAGTVYPRLAKLEDEGLVTRTPDGRRTVYTLTDAGRAELAEREHELRDVEDDVTTSIRSLADQVRAGVDEAMKSLRAELAAAAREQPSRPEHGPGAVPDARSESRVALQRAEIAITEFRSRVRVQLRRASSSAEGLPDAVVDELERGLTEVADRVSRALNASS